MMDEELELLAGFHAVQTLLKAQPERAVELLLSHRKDQRLQKTLSLAERTGIAVTRVSIEQLDTLADRHQGCVLKARPGVFHDERWMLQQIASMEQHALVLVLDGVTDPHNLGACLRSSEAAGVDMVVVPRDRSVGLTPVVRKVASGAAETVPLVVVTNLNRTLQKLQRAGLWITGAAAGANAAYTDMDFRAASAIVVGSEGSGLRRLTRERCDQLVQIPMLGSVDSLNVSVATGVLLFEVVRQRGS